MVEIERAMQFLAKPAPGDLAQVCKPRESARGR
jgi:hypothetical protein